MPIPIPEEEQYSRIQQLADEIYYNSDGGELDKVYELVRLASPYPYTDFDRNMMLRYLERYRSLKRQTNRTEAWARVRDHAHKIGGFAAIARHTRR